MEFALEAAGIGRLDLDLKTGIANRSLRHDRLRVRGLLAAQWTYASMLLDHILPEDRQHVSGRFEAAIDGGSICEFECRIKTP